MRSFPNLLDSVISKKFHYFKKSDDKSIVYFEEIKNEIKERAIFKLLSNQISETCFFEFDKDDAEVYPFFEAKAGLRTKNDFIIVHQKGNTVYIFLIELKSTNPTGYLTQLRAGKQFFQFIIERIKLASASEPTSWTDFNLPEFEKLTFVYKGILFKTKNTNATENTTSSRRTTLKETTKHSKLPFKRVDSFDIYHQSYDNTYYLLQFI
jgi:hypothetical protein